MCIHTFLGGLGDIDGSNRFDLYLYLYLYPYLYLHIYMLLHAHTHCFHVHVFMTHSWFLNESCTWHLKVQSVRKELTDLLNGDGRKLALGRSCLSQGHSSIYCLPCLPSVLGFEDHLVIVLDWDARELPHSPAVIQGPIFVAARDCRLTRSGHLLSLSVRTPVPRRKVACIADLLFNKTTDRLMVQDAINLQGSLRISPAGQPEDSRPDSG